jgi:hypothetical protein
VLPTKTIDASAPSVSTCGTQYSGGVSSAAQSIGEKTEEAIKLGRKLAMDIQEKRSYPEQLKLIENGKQHFRLIIEARKKGWAGEHQYWQDKGWL